MSLLNISKENIEIESSIQINVNKALNDNTSFVFDSGAGSGKTYSLISSIRYLLNKYRKKLVINNTKVLCITYTNIAADEIKERLGETNLVEVSTIHNMLWSFIENYQKQLVDIHKRNLIKIKKRLIDNLIDEGSKEANKFLLYRELDDDTRDEFYCYTLLVREEFYKNYNKPANKFRTSLGDDLLKFGKIGKNVTNLKVIMQCIYKLENIKKCILSIEDKEDGYTSIRYHSSNNRDILHRMIISHDSVINYSHQLFKNHPLVRKIFADMYPYVLIDEYQDSNPKVIDIMCTIDVFSKEKNTNFVVGYFGDKAQNIYDDGVGDGIFNIHKNLVLIRKQFNRRSHEEIITVINKVRNDNIFQDSIFSDSHGGSVKFYQLSKTIDQDKAIDSFINRYVNFWKATEKNKIHCLVLTNKVLARLSGFPCIYTKFSSSGYYKTYYDRINLELLNSNISKLGKVPLLLYKALHLYNLLNRKTNISNIFSHEFINSQSYKELSFLLSELKSIKMTSVNEYFKCIFEHYKHSSRQFKIYIDELFMIEGSSYDNFIDYISTSINPELVEEDELEKSRNDIIDLLSLSIKEFKCWYDYITGNTTGNITYHTYHGTKGIEFENVVIIMENDFGIRNKNKFSKYFSDTKLDLENFDFNQRKEYENTRNLLYVSCSRSIKNLRLLYLDDVTNFKDGVENIFSKVYIYHG